MAIFMLPEQTLNYAYKMVVFSCIAFFLSLFSAYTLAATLTSSVDRTTIDMDETLLLTVSLDKQGADDIDFSALELQFDILQRQRSSQTSIVNGRINAKTQWLLVLSPKETGDLVIPSFSSLGAFSDAVTITVTDNKNQASPPTNPSNNPSANSLNTPSDKASNTTHRRDDVFLEASIDKNNIYVQEQLLLTLTLYYRISLSGYTPQDLTIANSTVELTAENNTKKMINGISYNALERVYAIHPQASGELTIPSQSWQVEKSVNNFGFGRITSPYLRTRSEPLSVTVKPIPTQSTATQWLPAKSITLEQQWDQSTITAKVGEPLTYSLTLKADGLGHSQLPTINIDSDDNFTVYSDQAETDNQLSRTGVEGMRVSHYAVIPKKTGSYTLPAITLTWWNTITDKQETIRLKPQKIIVGKSQLTANASTNQLPEQNLAAEPLVQTTNQDTRQVVWLKITTGVLLSLTLLFLTLWIRAQRRLMYSKSVATPIKNKEHQQVSLEKLYQSIDKVIETKQWYKLSPLVIQWAQIKTGKDINTQDDIAHYFPELEETLTALNKKLYGNNNTDWDVNLLIPLLKKQRYKKVKRDNDNTDTLKELYPE